MSGRAAVLGVALVLAGLTPAQADHACVTDLGFTYTLTAATARYTVDTASCGLGEDVLWMDISVSLVRSAALQDDTSAQDEIRCVIGSVCEVSATVLHPGFEHAEYGGALWYVIGLDGDDGLETHARLATYSRTCTLVLTAYSSC